MSKLQKLNERYEKLQGLIKAIEAATSKVYEQERQDRETVLAKFFTAEDGVEVEVNSSGVHVSKAGSGKYNSFIDIYVNDEWDDNDSKVFNKLYISTSSMRTDEVGEWIAERFEKQAHYTRLAIDFEDDILAEMNMIYQEALKQINKIIIPLRDLRKESREIYEEIEAIKKEARIKALNSEEGLTLQGKQVERWGDTFTEYPDLQVKWDWTIRNVRGLRIDRMSASGKSADITVKVKRGRWTTDDSKYVESIVDEKIERVRMENIESFLRYNNIEI